VKLSQRNVSLIVSFIIWGLLLLSVAVYQRHRWIDRIWLGAILAFLLLVTVNFVVQLHRRDGDPSKVSYQGYPRWFIRFAFDEDEESKPAQTTVCQV
jgi:phosphoglycerol transferase MdoB-like AlkP superfamily enzyme